MSDTPATTASQDANHLSKRLYNRSDKELANALELAANNFRKAILEASATHVGSFEILRRVLKNAVQKDGKIDHDRDTRSCDLNDLLESIKTMCFERLKEGNREAAVAAFIAKVDRLSNEVKELRGDVDNLQHG